MIEASAALAAVARDLPEHIASLEGDDLVRVRHILSETEDRLGEAFVYALVLVMLMPRTAFSSSSRHRSRRASGW